VGAAGPVHAGENEFRVTLIGSGIPVPAADRFGPATLVEAGDQKLLFDCGRGATIRLWQLRIPLSKISALFLTHFHSDHTVGIPDLWLTGWLSSHFAARKGPFHVIGPVGTSTMMRHLEAAYAPDIEIRVEDEKRPLRRDAREIILRFRHDDHDEWILAVAHETTARVGRAGERRSGIRPRRENDRHASRRIFRRERKARGRKQAARRKTRDQRCIEQGSVKRADGLQS